jgi:hypothetical protein
MAGAVLPNGSERVARLSRLWWVVLAAIAVASIANIVVYLIATALFEGPRNFAMLQPGSIIGSTAVFLLVAAVVYVLIGRFAARPVRLFRRVGYAVLVLSFLMPVVAALSSPAGQGPDATTVVVLIVMHVVAGLITIYLFTTLGTDR